MSYSRIELKIPVFFGGLVSLVLCALAAIHLQKPVQSFLPEPHALTPETAEECPGTDENFLFFTRSGPQSGDFILELYRQPETRERVVSFFSEIAGPEISEVILANADAFNVPPALALALCWEESRLNPMAVNTANRDESIDRGLFQLNSRSFPRLETQAFFNLSVNAYYGLSHLRHCLDTGGSEITALAMYNAGTNRVNNTGAPRATLDYIGRILDTRSEIDSRFLEREGQFGAYPEEITGITESGSEPERSRFVLLKPLGIR